MTNRKINKAIAEHLGWKEFSSFSDCKQIIGKRPFFKNGKIVSYTVDQYVPDYCNDLNAMAKAEELLSNEQLQTYFYVLRPVVESTAKPGRGYVFTAKASQRAKAFVITIEKWKK
jgi:hypothetical protein